MAIRRVAGFAFLALEFGADMALAPFGRRGPKTAGPRRIVTDVLVVAAVELGDPVLCLILMESYDCRHHLDCSLIV